MKRLLSVPATKHPCHCAVNPLTGTDLSTDRQGGPATQCMWFVDLCAVIYQLPWHVSYGCMWCLFVRPMTSSCMSSAPFASRVQGSSLTLRLLHGTRTAEAIAATSTASQIRLAEVFASAIAEHAGIVAASAIFSIGHVSGARLAQHMALLRGTGSVISTPVGSLSRHADKCRTQHATGSAASLLHVCSLSMPYARVYTQHASSSKDALGFSVP